MRLREGTPLGALQHIDVLLGHMLQHERERERETNVARCALQDVGHIVTCATHVTHAHVPYNTCVVPYNTCVVPKGTLSCDNVL